MIIITRENNEITYIYIQYKNKSGARLMDQALRAVIVLSEGQSLEPSKNSYQAAHKPL